jgi:hypothetical protein
MENQQTSQQLMHYIWFESMNFALVLFRLVWKKCFKVGSTCKIWYMETNKPQIALMHYIWFGMNFVFVRNPHLFEKCFKVGSTCKIWYMETNKPQIVLMNYTWFGMNELLFSCCSLALKKCFKSRAYQHASRMASSTKPQCQVDALHLVCRKVYFHVVL